MTEKVRIGFVGVGNMGQAAHLRNYVTIPECEVVAVSELRPKLREAVAQRYGIGRTYENAGEMLANEKLDGIVASQPFDRHGSIIAPLYQAGVPIFTEKPLAASIRTGEKLLTTLAAGGSWHMLGYHKRSDPATMYACAEIDRLKGSGELGKLTYVRILMPAGDWTASGFRDLVRTDEAAPAIPADTASEESTPAYVSFVNYYIHQVNLLRHLLGEPYRVTYADPSGVLLAAQSESGVAATIEMSPYKTTIDWQESALIAFEKGYIKLELPAPLAYNRPGTVEVFSDPGGRPPQTVAPQLPWNHAMRQQAINFIAAVRGERSPMCEAAEALEDLKVARDYIAMRGH